MPLPTITRSLPSHQTEALPARPPFPFPLGLAEEGTGDVGIRNRSPRSTGLPPISRGKPPRASMAPSDPLAELPEPDLRIPPGARWAGEGLEIPEGTLPPDDLERLAVLYEALEGLYRRWHALEADPTPADRTEVAEGIRAFDREPLASLHEQLGRERGEGRADRSPQLRRALHDLRGGAFFALRLYANLLEGRTPEPDEAEAAALLARDQAKVVRSLVPSIDPAGHARDRSERAHGMLELVDKWNGFVFPRVEPPVRVEVEAPWRGDLASRCLEAAALDRVLYNLLNNAARFTADGRVRLRVERVGRSARLAVANRMREEERRWLAEGFGDDPSTLFLGGRTRGGSGVGMVSGASIVARAWGQVDAADAVTLGAVGARVDGDAFVAWVHWPVLLGNGNGGGMEEGSTRGGQP
jgi:hypothetical protein